MWEICNDMLQTHLFIETAEFKCVRYKHPIS